MHLFVELDAAKEMAMFGIAPHENIQAGLQRFLVDDECHAYASLCRNCASLEQKRAEFYSAHVLCREICPIFIVIPDICWNLVTPCGEPKALRSNSGQGVGAGGGKPPKKTHSHAA
jgi:hypothetical protein